MAEWKDVPDVMILCKLLDKEIPQDFCYEINLVAVAKYAKESFVPEVTDWDKAKKLCPDCEVSYYMEGREDAKKHDE